MDRRDGAGKVWAQERRGTVTGRRDGRRGRRWWYEYKRVMSWHQDGCVDPACHSKNRFILIILL
jgi:hypothetical protein